MKNTFDFVKPYIKKTELENVNFLGTINSKSRIVVSLPNIYNCAYVTEPFIQIKISEMPSSIDFSKILSKIVLEMGGYVVDRLYTEQIRIHGKKYNCEPSLIEDTNTIIIPLPFNCLLKSNGFILNNNRLFEVKIIIEFSDFEINNIECEEFYINYSELNNEFSMEDMTNYFYKQMIQTKVHQDRLLKINNECPSDYISYYFIDNLLEQNKKKLLDISNMNNSDSNSNKNSNSNQNINQVNNNESKKFNLPIGLLGFKQAQFTGLENINSANKRYRFIYNHDVETMYICIVNSKNDIYESKWFDLCKIQVNGRDTLFYTYEQLIHINKSTNLPKGVLEIPNISYVNFDANNIEIHFSDIRLDDNETFYFFSSVESSNWLTIGPMISTVFG